MSDERMKQWWLSEYLIYYSSFTPRFIYTLMHKKMSEILVELESCNVLHHNMSALKVKHLDKRKGRSFQNYRVIGTTVHGALLHKQALSEVSHSYSFSVISQDLS